MQMSSDITKLTEAMAKVQSEIENVEKNQTNPFFKSKYADLGAMLDSCRPILSKNGLSIVQLPCHKKGTLKYTKTVKAQGEYSVVKEYVPQIGVKTIVTHESGQWLSEEVFIPLEGERGRSLAQSAGAVITFLRRYAYAACVGVAQVDEDGNHQGVAKNNVADITPLKRLTEKMRVEPEFKKRVLEYLSKLNKGMHDLTESQILGMLEPKQVKEG